MNKGSDWTYLYKFSLPPCSIIIYTHICLMSALGGMYEVSTFLEERVNDDMLRFMQIEWKFFLILFMIISMLGLCYYEYKQYKAEHQPVQSLAQPNITINTAGEKSKPGEAQVVYVQGQNTNTKEIVYVPKEVDAKTGSMEKTDVQFETRQGKVYVKVNGKDFEVPVDVKEDTKFEKGKLVVTEKSEMRINITAPKPAFNVGLGWSQQGAAAQVNGPLFKNVSWWVYGDKKTLAGGLQFPIMK